MDDIFFGDRYRNGYHAIINQQTNTEVAYSLIYDAIMEHPSYVIFSTGDPEGKCRVLESMIKYYESLEEYEKCANLLRIQKTIQL